MQRSDIPQNRYYPKVDSPDKPLRSPNRLFVQGDRDRLPIGGLPALTQVHLSKLYEIMGTEATQKTDGKEEMEKKRSIRMKKKKTRKEKRAL